MQTQIQPTEPTQNVFADEERALAQIRRLEGELADHEADAERARVAFEREPTEHGHASRAVAEQKAKNVKATLEAARLEVQPALDRASVQRQADELIGTRQELAELDREIDAQVDQLEGIINELAPKLVGFLEGLHSHVVHRNHIARLVEDLSRGAERCGRLSVGYLIGEKLNPRLVKRFGNGMSDATRMLAFKFVQGANAPSFHLEFRHPRPNTWTER